MQTIEQLQQALETHSVTSILDEKLRPITNKLEDLSKIELKNHNMIVYWDILNDKAKIPTKRKEDAGFDIYTIEDDCVLKPGETKMFRTGLKSAFASNYWAEIKERGSTGAVGLSVRSGVIDSGYRGEWKIMLTNVNNYPVEFSSEISKTTYVYGKIFKKRIKKIIYPLSKAIAQAVFIPLPNVMSRPWPTDESVIENSERGATGWGASGK